MKYIVAVSGGVDSVVLLDMMSRRADNHLIVAHFDHGIRPGSAADARFVEGLAKAYRLPCLTHREELGQQASEELARERRYAFLHEAAASHGARLVTAHHRDDLIETITQNITRGTGWRGLAVFGDKRTMRPLLGKTKAELYAYALRHDLEWVEDETNRSQRYTRNRLRQVLGNVPADTKDQLVDLYTRQHELALRIESEQCKVGEENMRSRYFMTMIPDKVACELLRTVTHGRLHRPQLGRLLLAIKTYAPGTVYEAGAGVSVRFRKRDFIVEMTSGMYT